MNLICDEENHSSFDVCADENRRWRKRREVNPSVKGVAIELL